MGGVAGLLLLALFLFPQRAYPLESLILTGAVVLAGGALLLTPRGRPAPSLRRMLRSPGLLAVAGFALWSFARWRAQVIVPPGGEAPPLAIPSAGRPAVVARLTLVAGLVLGLGLSRAEPVARGERWRGFRVAWALGAAGFGLLALYQYVWGYTRAHASLTEGQASSLLLTDLMRQSLEHALRERRVGGRLGDSNLFAAQMAVLGMMSLSLWEGPVRSWTRLIGAGGFGMAALAVALSGSRGGGLTFLAGAAAAVVFVFRRREREGRARSFGMGPGAVLVAGGFCGMAAVARAADLWARLGNVSTIRERLYYWSIATKVWGQDVLLGAGPGAFALYYAALKPPAARESRYAHSWIFQAAAETGLVGLALFGFFVASVVWAGWRLYRGAGLAPPDQGHAPAAWAGLWSALGAALLCLNGLVEHSLDQPEFLLWLGALAGGALVSAVEPARSAEGSPLGSPGHQAASGAGAVGLGLCLSALGWYLPPQQIAYFWEGEAVRAAEAGDHARAAEHYARARVFLPDHEGYLSGVAMATFYADARKAGPALELLQGAIEMNPLSAALRRNQARVLEGMGDLPGARTALEAAVGLYPNDAGGRLELARVALELGDTAAAAGEIEFIVEKGLPLWEFQRPLFEELRSAVSRAEGSADADSTP